MKYLKLFENFNDVESTKDNLYDLFFDGVKQFFIEQGKLGKLG